MNYAIVDIEATGGKQGEEDIIEVAIYRYDGEHITDQMISLISPDREIDQYVQRLTHITMKMVQTAPKFYEVAKRVIEITDDAILVGHNIEFDYRMLKQEFRKLGYSYRRETIDTVTLSQEFFPDASSHSLGKLSKELGIPVADRHRASGDARATLELFKLLLEKDATKKLAKADISKTESEKKSASSYMDLPAHQGIVYFFDADKQALFLTRAKNIAQKTRKLINAKTGLGHRIRTNYERIRYELTGGPLLTQVKELNELNKLKPRLNRNPRQTGDRFCIGLEKKKGYMCLTARKGRRSRKSDLIVDVSAEEAKEILLHLTEKYELCPRLNGISQEDVPCLALELGKCKGACEGKESAEEYNERIQLLQEEIDLSKRTILLTDKGRKPGESSFVLVENGSCTGYGYYELYHQIKSIKRVQGRMTETIPDRKEDRLVRLFLLSGRYEKQMELKD